MKKILLVTIALSLFLSSQALASTMTLTQTTDNRISSLFVYDQGAGSVHAAYTYPGDAIDNGSWQTATSFNLDVADNTTYDLFFQIVNQGGAPGSSNPVAFLGQLELPDGSLLLSSASWSVSGTASSTPWQLSDWVSATSYGANSDSSTIWFRNNGLIAGIDASAEWVGLGAYPGTAETFWLKVTVTTSPVPLPGAALLLGSGLLGLVGLRRRVRH